MKGTDSIKFDYAQVGRVSLHYAKAGDAGRLVILLHGFPECWYSWRHQLAALADDYTVVAPDMRGFNLSDKPQSISDYRLDNIVDDVIGLIHHFGHTQAAVIGHDWGGAVAWQLAAEHPQYLWKVGALQTPPPRIMKKNMSLRQALASWYMFLFQLPFLPELLLKFNDYKLLENSLRKSTADTGVFTDENISQYRKAWSEPGALTGMVNYYRANVLHRFIGRHESDKKITVPSLFIFGEKDFAILHETVQGIGEMIDAPFADIRIADSGHWVQQEAREEVTAVIRDFLAT